MALQALSPQRLMFTALGEKASPSSSPAFFFSWELARKVATSHMNQCVMLLSREVYERSMISHCVSSIGEHVMDPELPFSAAPLNIDDDRQPRFWVLKAAALPSLCARISNLTRQLLHVAECQGVVFEVFDLRSDGRIGSISTPELCLGEVIRDPQNPSVDG